MPSLIEWHFAHELIKHGCDAWRPAHSGEATALHHDANLAAQPLHRIREIGCAATTCVAVLARQGQQRQQQHDQDPKTRGDGNRKEVFHGLLGFRFVKKLMIQNGCYRFVLTQVQRVNW